MIDALTGDPRITAVARVAHTFRLDPLRVMSDTDPFHWAVLVAAHAQVVADSASSIPEEG